MNATPNLPIINSGRRTPPSTPRNGKAFASETTVIIPRMKKFFSTNNDILFKHDDNDSEESIDPPEDDKANDVYLDLDGDANKKL